MDIRSKDVISALWQKVENYDPKTWSESIGHVIQAGDGIAKVSGLHDCMYGEMLQFENGIIGMAMNIEPDSVGCVLFGDESEIRDGSEVRSTGRPVEVPVGDALIGRVVMPWESPSTARASCAQIRGAPSNSPRRT